MGFCKRGALCSGKDPTPTLHPKSGLPDFGANMSNSAIAEFDWTGREKDRSTAMPMNAVYRGPADLPGTIPVFPLPGALLLLAT